MFFFPSSEAYANISHLRYPLACVADGCRLVVLGASEPKLYRRESTSIELTLGESVDVKNAQTYSIRSKTNLDMAEKRLSLFSV